MESQIKSSVSEKMYANKIRYFERPLSSNTPYPFRVLHAVNPYDFTLGLEDKEGKELEKRLERVLGDYAEELGFLGEGGKKEVELKEDWYYPGMPIMIKDSAGGKPGVLRGEVLEIQGQFLTVLRVDRGGVRSLAKSNALPVTQAVLRVPKLGVVCRMAQIRPEKGDTWPALKEWAKDWEGKSSSVTLLDYYPASRSFEVSLEVDKVNVALNYFLTGVALPVELATFEKADGFPFPVNDFSTWMGLKVNVFGTKVFQDKKDDNKVKCVLQMDPEVANKILDEVAALPVELTTFEKADGFPFPVNNFSVYMCYIPENNSNQPARAVHPANQTPPQPQVRQEQPPEIQPVAPQPQAVQPQPVQPQPIQPVQQPEPQPGVNALDVMAGLAVNAGAQGRGAFVRLQDAPHGPAPVGLEDGEAGDREAPRQ